jgi:hypothetical protein
VDAHAAAGGGGVTTYYKVLTAAGESCHGGTMQWSLPTRAEDGSWTPGEWHEVAGVIECCRRGLHLTDTPVNWWLEGARVFVAEYEGDVDTSPDADDDKIAVRRARLVAEEAWAPLGVVSDGWHTVTSGLVRASGRATVEASDSATVLASGSATVEASGSATVEASGSATVLASGRATVVRSPYHTGGSVSLADGAALVDRRAGYDVVPTCRVAPWSDAPESAAVEAR